MVDDKIRSGDLSQAARAAKEAHDRHDWTTALALWDVCLRDYPADHGVPGLRQSRAAALAELGRHNEAKDAYWALTQDCPDIAAGFSGLARLAQIQRDWPEACTGWRTCLEKFPTHSSVFRWRHSLGIALIECGCYAEADEIYRALATERPDAAAGLVGLALVAQRQKAWAETVKRWNACIARFPHNSGAWRTSRAIALERVGAWRQAYEAWDALTLESGSGRTSLIARARCYVHVIGPTDEAERLVAAALDAFPEDLPTRTLYASMAAGRGDNRGAVTRYLRCIQLHPGEVSFYHLGMEAALRAGDVRTADRLIAKAPEGLAKTIEFRCRVLLNYHRLFTNMNIESGLQLVKTIGESDEIDLHSARAIGHFLNYAADYERLLAFSGRMLKRFRGDPTFIILDLVATYHARGCEDFEIEKTRLLASLNASDTVAVLRGLGPTWLSASEAQEVIIDGFAGNRRRALGFHPVISLAYRSDTETLTYLADQLANCGDTYDRFLSKSLLAMVSDRRRVNHANLGESCLADFKKTSQSMAAEFAKMLDKPTDVGAPSSLVGPASTLQRLMERCKAAWIFSAECYYDAAAFADWLADRIRGREATSVLRLGDGEGTFLPYPASVRDFQEPDQRALQQIWWGEARLVGERAEAIMDQFVASVLRADAVGVPSPRRLIIDFQNNESIPSRRRLASGLNFLDGLDSERLRSKVLTSCHIHNDLYMWGLYRQIFDCLSTVSVISCHDLARTLAERFSLVVRQWLRIPPEHKYVGMFAPSKNHIDEPFYPLVFERVIASVTPLPGEVFLVAAGFLGKLVCDRIRERGGIALDIGSTADLWMGYVTRRETLHNA